MCMKNYIWCWKKKQIFYLVYIVVMLLLVKLSAKLISSKAILTTTFHFEKQKTHSCTVRECTLEEKHQHGALLSSFQPAWSGCHGDFYLMAFDNSYSSKYTLLDVGANKAYAVATWLAFFLPKLNINQAVLYDFLLRNPALTSTCGSCDDCKDAAFKQRNTEQNVTLNIHAFEPQPGTVEVLKSVQSWMNISARHNSTLNIHSTAVSK